MARHSLAVRHRLAIAAAALAVTLAADRPEAADLIGRATVIDGDELEIGGRRVALAGIAAPAEDEVCGQRYCGIEAAFVLAETVERHWVECTTAPENGGAGAICRVGGAKGWDVNARMVASGWATATGARYRKEEEEARHAERGLWARSAPISP